MLVPFGNGAVVIFRVIFQSVSRGYAFPFTTVALPHFVNFSSTTYTERINLLRFSRHRFRSLRKSLNNVPYNPSICLDRSILVLHNSGTYLLRGQRVLWSYYRSAISRKFCSKWSFIRSSSRSSCLWRSASLVSSSSFQVGLHE